MYVCVYIYIYIYIISCYTIYIYIYILRIPRQALPARAPGDEVLPGLVVLLCDEVLHDAARQCVVEHRLLDAGSRGAREAKVVGDAVLAGRASTLHLKGVQQGSHLASLSGRQAQRQPPLDGSEDWLGNLAGRRRTAREKPRRRGNDLRRQHRPAHPPITSRRLPPCRAAHARSVFRLAYSLTQNGYGEALGGYAYDARNVLTSYGAPATGFILSRASTVRTDF